MCTLRARYGPEHMEVVSVMAAIAETYVERYGDGLYFHTQKDEDTRQAMLTQALQLLEGYDGVVGLEVARTMLSVGGGLEHPKSRFAMNGGRPLGPDVQQAERKLGILKRATEALESLKGPEDAELAFGLKALAFAHGELGDFEAQLDHQRRALWILDSVHGSRHPAVARTLADLGTTYGELGDQANRRAFLEESVAAFEALYGPSNIEVGQVLSDLGLAYVFLDHTKAYPILQRALRIKEKAYGGEDPDVAKTCIYLSHAAGGMGDKSEQRALLERAIPIVRKELGRNNPELAQLKVYLGNCLADMGDKPEALSLLHEALAVFRTTFGLDHPHCHRVQEYINSPGTKYIKVTHVGIKKK